MDWLPPGKIIASNMQTLLHPRSIAGALLAATLIGALSAAAAADTPEQTAAQLGQKALANSGALDILTSLTTEVGPRLAGSDAEKRAAAWAKRRFESFGFNKVWLESFPLAQGWARGEEHAEIVSPSPQPLLITALGGSVATPPEGLEAEIALFKTYEDLLAQPTHSLAGKIAVVTQRMVRAPDGGGYGALNQIRSRGPGEAARRGAIAYLHRSLSTDTHRFPHTGATAYPDDVTPIPAAALSVPDAEQLERLAELGQPVRLRLKLTPRQLGPVTSQNVVAEITGREAPDQIVLLGAHLDSWDLGTGALDDGAGVAIVMAAAKLIRDLPEPPRRTLRVVLYGAEEFGLVGGKAYAQAHAAESTNIMIVAEPDFGQGPVYRFLTGVADPEEPSLKRIRSALAPLGVIAGDNHSGGESDVIPLAQRHVPAATLELNGSDYFDFHHTPDDTLDKVKPERIHQSAAAYAVFAYLAAELHGDYRQPPAASGK